MEEWISISVNFNVKLWPRLVPHSDFSLSRGLWVIRAAEPFLLLLRVFILFSMAPKMARLIIIDGSTAENNFAEWNASSLIFRITSGRNVRHFGTAQLSGIEVCKLKEMAVRLSSG